MIDHGTVDHEADDFAAERLTAAEELCREGGAIREPVDDDPAASTRGNIVGDDVARALVIGLGVVEPLQSAPSRSVARGEAVAYAVATGPLRLAAAAFAVQRHHTRLARGAHWSRRTR